MSQIILLKNAGCKNPQKSLNYLLNSSNAGCTHEDGFEHWVEFCEETGLSGDDSVFLSISSCDDFHIWMNECLEPSEFSDEEKEELGILNNDSVEYIHYIDGRTVAIYARNEKGYLHNIF